MAGRVGALPISGYFPGSGCFSSGRAENPELCEAETPLIREKCCTCTQPGQLGQCVLEKTSFPRFFIPTIVVCQFFLKNSSDVFRLTSLGIWDITNFQALFLTRWIILANSRVFCGIPMRRAWVSLTR
jgi:hypothetical protein